MPTFSFRRRFLKNKLLLLIPGTFPSIFSSLTCVYSHRLHLHTTSTSHLGDFSPWIQTEWHGTSSPSPSVTSPPYFSHLWSKAAFSAPCVSSHFVESRRMCFLPTWYRTAMTCFSTCLLLQSVKYYFYTHSSLAQWLAHISKCLINVCQ